MSEDSLLSRRQILGLFGGGVGAAIIGSTSAQTDTQADGNLYGGINGMAQSYQVGEGMYKGPLSTRSEVPKEDGNTFIQTDAGNNGNQFQFYHYNGGWAAQGWDLPSLSTDELQDGVATSGNTVSALFGERINSQSPSGVGGAAFTVTSDYDVFVISFSNVVPDTDSVQLQLQVSNDGGSTFQSGTSDYRWVSRADNDGGSGATLGSQGDSSIQVTGDPVGSASGEFGVSGTIKVFQPTNSGVTTHVGKRATSRRANGVIQSVTGGGAYDTAESVDTVRIKFGSGNIESGEVDLLGVMG